jgi:hypothetical protein
MRPVQFSIPALSTLAFSTTGCFEVDKLTGEESFTETEVGDGEMPGDSSIGSEGLPGVWDGTNIGDMQLPYVYEESYEGVVYTSTMWLKMTIDSDYTGELSTYQEYSYTSDSGDPTTETENYSYALSASGSHPDFLIAATDGDGSTILLDCSMTDADTLDCTYSVDGEEDPDYTLGFERR